MVFFCDIFCLVFFLLCDSRTRQQSGSDASNCFVTLSLSLFLLFFFLNRSSLLFWLTQVFPFQCCHFSDRKSVTLWGTPSQLAKKNIKKRTFSLIHIKHYFTVHFPGSLSFSLLFLFLPIQCSQRTCRLDLLQSVETLLSLSLSLFHFSNINYKLSFICFERSYFVLFYLFCIFYYLRNV